MTHDEEFYKNPETYNPDRYISKSDGGLGESLPVGPFVRTFLHLSNLSQLKASLETCLKSNSELIPQIKTITDQ